MLPQPFVNKQQCALIRRSLHTYSFTRKAPMFSQTLRSPDSQSLTETNIGHLSNRNADQDLLDVSLLPLGSPSSYPLQSHTGIHLFSIVFFMRTSHMLVFIVSLIHSDFQEFVPGSTPMPSWREGLWVWEEVNPLGLMTRAASPAETRSRGLSPRPSSPKGYSF